MNLLRIVFLLIIVGSANNICYASSIIKKSTDYLEFEGKIVDSIVIENRNIFDTKSEKYNKFVFRAANKFHITTQKKIIKRELLLSKNEPYSEALAEESARILRQRFVLYDAWIEKEIYDNDKLLVKVITIDQWSLSAGVDVKIEGNESRYKIGASEKNLLGLNRLISFYYINQSDDADFIEASFSIRRIFGRKLHGDVLISTNPLNTYTTYLIEKPFYDLKQQFRFFVLTSNREGRVDYYQNDTLTSQSFYKGNTTSTGLLYRVGSYEDKYVFSLVHSYNDEESNSTLNTNNLVQDSLFHALKIGIEHVKLDFKKLYNIDGFNYTEDINAGLHIGLSFQKAYSFSNKKTLYNMYGLFLRKKYTTENSFFSFQSRYRQWRDFSKTIRELTVLNLKSYYQISDDFTFASNTEFRMDESDKAYDFISLGGTTGVRGLDKYFLTGDKKAILNVELRLIPKYPILWVNLGGVLFSDFGNIQKSGESIMISETYSSFGAGLRIAFDKSSKNIIRIDFAYSKVNGWNFSFGSGQFFRAADII